MITSRQITDLIPAAGRKCYQFIIECNHNGIDVIITSTYRDEEAQHELWLQGRGLPGPIVTNADAGQSFHNYRVAFDFVPIVNGKASWNDDALFNKCGEIAEGLNLTWAGRWTGKLQEKCHCQYTNGLTLKDFEGGKTV